MSGARYRLAAQREPLCPRPPQELADLPQGVQPGPQGWLWHQAETFTALGEHGLVLNTSATGTGKTLAAQTHLLRGARRALFVAPTNALVAQHAADLRRFVTAAGLAHLVVAADAAGLRGLRRGQARPLDNGQVLADLLAEPGSLVPAWAGRPLCIVTNPDIFTLATFFRYGGHAGNAGANTLADVDYLVIDEVHYYSAPQLAALFFSLGLWSQGVGERASRRVLLLSATPDGDLTGAMESLSRLGLRAHVVDPAVADPGLPQVVSLAPVELELRAEGKEALTGALLWLIPAVQAGEDGALLCDSLEAISGLYARARTQHGLGGEVRRITGPTPPEHREAAQRARLVLATPTVDLGFNFAGSGDKDRQPLDRVAFTAPTLDRFWQRLGRAGRVLCKRRRDVPSRALALIPGAVLGALPEEGEMSRAELRGRLIDAAAGRMDRPSLAMALSGWGRQALCHGWAGLSRAVSDDEVLRPVYEAMQELVRLPPFAQGLAIGKGLRELEEICGGRRAIEDPHNRLGWLSSPRADQRDALERKKQEFLRPPPGQPAEQRRRLVEKMRAVAVEEGACLRAALAFRGEAVYGADAWVWDEIGRYADLRAWVKVDLWRALRRDLLTVLRADEAQALGDAGEEPDLPRLFLRGGRERSLRPVLCYTGSVARMNEMRGRVFGLRDLRLELRDRDCVVTDNAEVVEELNRRFLAHGVAMYMPRRSGQMKEVMSAYSLYPVDLEVREPGAAAMTAWVWIGSAAVIAAALEESPGRAS